MYPLPRVCACSKPCDSGGLCNGIMTSLRSKALAAQLLDVLSAWGNLRTRAMFGGIGVYRDDVFFALIDDETVFVKTDAQSVVKHAQAGLPCFRYQRDGQWHETQYHAVPPDALDDPDELLQWLVPAWRAALRKLENPVSRKKTTKSKKA